MDTMERRAAVMASDLLVAALEDLSQEQLKRFRLKLQDEPLDGRSIPRGRLERADALELSQQLVQFYGPEVALDVALKTLKRADVRDVAAQLKEQRRQRERGGVGWGGDPRKRPCTPPHAPAHPCTPPHTLAHPCTLGQWLKYPLVP